MGKMVADIISKTEKPVVAEGQEPPEFWVALGGKTSYANSKRYELRVPSPSLGSLSAPSPLASSYHNHVSPPGYRKRIPLCPPGSLNALTRQAGSWPLRLSTSPRMIWMRMMFTCWTLGTRCAGHIRTCPAGDKFMSPGG